MNWARAIWFWLRSRPARRSLARQRHIRHLLSFQCDAIPAEGEAQVRAALAGARAAWSANDLPAVRSATATLSAAADQWLVDTWKHHVRGTFETLAVAFTTIMAGRTFFVQPMAIPTGSMQPTLWGVTTQNLRGTPAAELPGFWQQFYERLVEGRRYYRVVAEGDGKVTAIDPAAPAISWLPGLPSLRKQRFLLGTNWHTIWFPPAEVPSAFNLESGHALLVAGGVRSDQEFKRGDEVFSVSATSGDHILVDRFTYNFRRPERGDIIVFTTAGIPGVNERTHYIKRLVGLGGDRLRIGDDHHLVVNGRRLDSSDPGFEQVYSGSGELRENTYSGHINDRTAQRLRQRPRSLAPLFPNAQAEVRIPPHQLLTMGDNTLGSADGRRWGAFDQSHVIGRCLAVYWPVLRPKPE